MRLLLLLLLGLMRLELMMLADEMRSHHAVLAVRGVGADRRRRQRRRRRCRRHQLGDETRRRRRRRRHRRGLVVTADWARSAAVGGGVNGNGGRRQPGEECLLLQLTVVMLEERTRRRWVMLVVSLVLLLLLESRMTEETVGRHFEHFAVDRIFLQFNSLLHKDVYLLGRERCLVDGIDDVCSTVSLNQRLVSRLTKSGGVTVPP